MATRPSFQGTYNLVRGLPLTGDGGGAEARPRHTCPGRGAHSFTHTLKHDMANVY